MNANPTEPNLLREQYRTPSNLNARASLHERFRTNPRGWFPWYLEQLDLPTTSRILELGCGPGYLWQAALGQAPAGLNGWRITLSDLSGGMLAAARQRLGGAGSLFGYAVADAQSIPFPDGHFDAVLANHMLYHVPDRPRALAEIRRVLRPGGRLFAATNGQGHMQTLSALVTRLTDGLDEERHVPGLWSRHFTLENGPAQLAPFFAQVELRRYLDDLEITQAGPLVDYVLSTIANSSQPPAPEQVQAFQALLEQDIARLGAIRIQKDVGLLLGVRAA